MDMQLYRQQYSYQLLIIKVHTHRLEFVEHHHHLKWGIQQDVKKVN